MSKATAKAPAAKAPKAPEIPQVLNGSSVQPSMIDINGTEVQLGVVVGRAFTDSGLTADEWNALPEDDCEARIVAAIEAMRAEPPADDKPNEDDEQEVVQRIDPSLIPIRKHGEPDLRVHPSALDEHLKLGWTIGE